MSFAKSKTKSVKKTQKKRIHLPDISGRMIELPMGSILFYEDGMQDKIDFDDSIVDIENYNGKRVLYALKADDNGRVSQDLENEATAYISKYVKQIENAIYYSRHPSKSNKRFRGGKRKTRKQIKTIS